MTIYGYARVSTVGQNLDSQIEALRAAGATRIFEEKVSGKGRANRPALERGLQGLSEGDVLVITRLDRLARSSRDLLNVIQQITEAGASFKSLGDAWADTTNAHGRLMLTILAGLAEFEATLIRERTGEGRERALKEGKVFGRRPKLTAHQRAEAIRRRDEGEPVTAIARSYNVHHALISRL